MTVQVADQLNWLRSLYNASLQALIEGNARISTWLVVGNAGALVIVFQALIGGSHCDVSQIAPSLWLFMAGLASAFLAVAMGAFVGSAVLTTLSDMINALWLMEKNEADLAELEKEHGALKDTALHASIAEQEQKAKIQLAKMVDLQKDAKRLIWLQVLSVLLFAMGVALPSLSPTLLASCLTETPVATSTP